MYYASFVFRAHRHSPHSQMASGLTTTKIQRINTHTKVWTRGGQEEDQPKTSTLSKYANNVKHINVCVYVLPFQMKMTYIILLTKCVGKYFTYMYIESTSLSCMRNNNSRIRHIYGQQGETKTIIIILSRHLCVTHTHDNDRR